MLLKYDCITEETANLSPTELYLTYRFDHELNHEPYCNGCKSPNVLSNMIGFAKNHGISLDLSNPQQAEMRTSEFKIEKS